MNILENLKFEFVNMCAEGRVMEIVTFAMNSPEFVSGGKEGLYVPTAIAKFGKGK